MYESRAKLEGSFFNMSLSMLSREGGGHVYVRMVSCTPAMYVASSSSEACSEYVG